MGPRVLPISIAAAILIPTGLPCAEEPAPPSAIPPLHEGAAAIEESRDATATLRAADAALASGKASEAAAILDALLGPAAPLGARVRTENPVLVTSDGVLYGSASREARRRVRKLIETEAGRDAWRARRGEAAEAEAAPAEASPASSPAEDWTGVLGQPDHAATGSGMPRVEPGSYARWAHRLTNYRKLESSQPARNYYYAYFPMQAATWKDLVFIRSHQDIVALAASTGDVR